MNYPFAEMGPITCVGDRHIRTIDHFLRHPGRTTSLRFRFPIPSPNHTEEEDVWLISDGNDHLRICTDSYRLMPGEKQVLEHAVREQRFLYCPETKVKQNDVIPVRAFRRGVSVRDVLPFRCNGEYPPEAMRVYRVPIGKQQVTVEARNAWDYAKEEFNVLFGKEPLLCIRRPSQQVPWISAAYQKAA